MVAQGNVDVAERVRGNGRGRLRVAEGAAGAAICAARNVRAREAAQPAARRDPARVERGGQSRGAEVRGGRGWHGGPRSNDRKFLTSGCRRDGAALTCAEDGAHIPTREAELAHLAVERVEDDERVRGRAVGDAVRIDRRARGRRREVRAWLAERAVARHDSHEARARRVLQHEVGRRVAHVKVVRRVDREGARGAQHAAGGGVERERRNDVCGGAHETHNAVARVADVHVAGAVERGRRWRLKQRGRGIGLPAVARVACGAAGERRIRSAAARNNRGEHFCAEARRGGFVGARAGSLVQAHDVSSGVDGEEGAVDRGDARQVRDVEEAVISIPRPRQREAEGGVEVGGQTALCCRAVVGRRRPYCVAAGDSRARVGEAGGAEKARWAAAPVAARGPRGIRALRKSHCWRAVGGECVDRTFLQSARDGPVARVWRDARRDRGGDGLRGPRAGRAARRASRRAVGARQARHARGAGVRADRRRGRPRGAARAGGQARGATVGAGHAGGAGRGARGGRVGARRAGEAHGAGVAPGGASGRAGWTQRAVGLARAVREGARRARGAAAPGRSDGARRAEGARRERTGHEVRVVVVRDRGHDVGVGRVRVGVQWHGHDGRHRRARGRDDHGAEARDGRDVRGRVDRDDSLRRAAQQHVVEAGRACCDVAHGAVGDAGHVN